MDTGLRFAAIDIGSNAIRLLFARIIENGKNKPYLIKESLIRMPLRLGQDVFIDGEISAINSEKFLKTLNGFKDLINAYEPISYRACATAAMRNAKNGQDLVASVKLKTNIKIEIIDGSEEATLILSKNINQYLKATTNYIHIDVGGGSTELSIINKNKAKISRSFPIGSVRLLQGEVNDASWQQMRGWIKDNIKNININRAIGSSAAIGFFIALFGAAGFLVSGSYLQSNLPLSIGFINIPAFLIFVPITTFMARIGASLLHKVDKKLISKLFGVFLIIVASKLLFDYLNL